MGKRDPELEAALVERFRGGDESAFNEIVGLYADKVLSMCTYTLKNGDEAWDVSQEVFMKIHRGLARFRGDAKLSTWIHTITLNACRNRLSSWRRLFARKRRWDADPNSKRSVETPEETFLRDERSLVVRDEIGKLRPKYRDILLLKDLQDCSYEEIGEILGLAPGTVKSRLHRARDALAERLARIWPELASKESDAVNGHHCQQDEWKLSALADGELPADEAEAVKAHLAGCEACAAAHARLEGLRRLLVESERPVAPADYLVKLRARMDAEACCPVPTFFSWARLAGLAAFLVVGVAVERGLNDPDLPPVDPSPSVHGAVSASSPSSVAEDGGGPGIAPAGGDRRGAPEIDGYLRSIRLAPDASSRSSDTMKTWRPRRVAAARVAPSSPVGPARSVPTPSRRLAQAVPSSGDALTHPIGLGSSKLASMSEARDDGSFEPSLRREAARLVLEPEDRGLSLRFDPEDATAPKGATEGPADAAWLETLFPARVLRLQGEARERFVEARDDRLRWMVESPRPRDFFRSLKDGLDELGLPVEAVFPAESDRWELYVELGSADEAPERRRRLRELLADLDAVSGLAFLEQTEEGNAPRGLWIVLDLAY